MTLPKLGEVIQGKYIVTARYPHGLPYPLGFVVLTPIPPGCVGEDLGVKFEAAVVQLQEMEPNQNLYRWLDGPATGGEITG